MPNFKSMSENRNWMHLFEVAYLNFGPFTNVRLTMDLDTVCFTNMVGDCLDMSTSIKPVFKAYQCPITIPTKLTKPRRTEDIYSSK